MLIAHANAAELTRPLRSSDVPGVVARAACADLYREFHDPGEPCPALQAGALPRPTAALTSAVTCARPP